MNDLFCLIIDFLCIFLDRSVYCIYTETMQIGQLLSNKYENRMILIEFLCNHDIILTIWENLSGR